ncbi:xylulokinase [Spongiactinospora sp. TRM90649]|uniref:xylulokinase n=1 Tax=Spongiactinospora sp. TRM90649 TaxID=3031114 RepID=UPI0023F6EBF0|nr:xylulokinase [Spongiactinospora sp. TRM90649]MDF5758991.1 xylulokinase [Spongiactinospora sp. TRM90649]
MTLVAGVDSSTQSCKVVIRDAETGVRVRAGRAVHPEGTEVHPDAWWAALTTAIERAGGLGDVSALSVAAQQHGMVCLDGEGRVVRPALLWNDTRSAGAAADLVAEQGGPAAWAETVGSVPLAAFTIAKLRWLAEHEPEHARRTAAVCLPHDWLTWRLTGSRDLTTLVTDRGDASGTGYWSPTTAAYRPDLLHLAFGSTPLLPKVLPPAAHAGVASGILLGAGTGDNMAAALGVGARVGDVVVSVGTSGTAFAVAEVPSRDPSGLVAGFADATGRFLPLACTLNAARVLDAAAAMAGVDLGALDELALAVPAGAGGLTLVPYLEGERTPDLPAATGSLHGLTLATATPAHLARAAVEGLLCHLADAVDALGLTPERVLLIGGGARSRAVREIAPRVLGRPVLVPEPGEYVADGAARQAAWALAGTAEPPVWEIGAGEVHDGEPAPGVRENYARVRTLAYPGLSG